MRAPTPPWRYALERPALRTDGIGCKSASCWQSTTPQCLPWRGSWLNLVVRRFEVLAPLLEADRETANSSKERCGRRLEGFVRERLRGRFVGREIPLLASNRRDHSP